MSFRAPITYWDRVDLYASHKSIFPAVGLLVFYSVSIGSCSGRASPRRARAKVAGESAGTRLGLSRGKTGITKVSRKNLPRPKFEKWCHQAWTGTLNISRKWCLPLSLPAAILSLLWGHTEASPWFSAFLPPNVPYWLEGGESTKKKGGPEYSASERKIWKSFYEPNMNIFLHREAVLSLDASEVRHLVTWVNVPWVSVAWCDS